LIVFNLQDRQAQQTGVLSGLSPVVSRHFADVPCLALLGKANKARLETFAELSMQ
jgi:hypothetical protein